MLQVLLLGFNNLDLNKFIFLQREDKNGCTWHKTRGQCVCKCLYVSLCVISGWVWVNERMVGVFCAHVCVRAFWCGCWPVPSFLSGGCWVVLGHQFLTRTRLASLYHGQLPVASGLLGLSPFGREHPIWGLPSSPAGMGMRDVWPQVYQK